MKTRFFTALAFLSLLASAALAQKVESVLTSDSTLWTASVPADTTRLELTRRVGEVRESLVVPSTDDEAIESQPRLAWDSRSGTLFVMWTRSTEGADEIRLAALRADGIWAEPMVVAADGARRAGLQLVLTSVHEAATEETVAINTALLHAAWWKIEGDTVQPEYALLAFESGSHISSDVSILSVTEEQGITEPEDTGDAIHPPLAMIRAGNGVDVIYGEKDSTAINRVKLEPRKIAGNARIWRPGRSVGGGRTPSSKIVSENTAPVQAFASNGRIVLYTPEAKFRFVVYENGEWSPTRMITLDESLSSEEMLSHLRRTIEDQVAPAEEAAAASQ